MGMPFYGQAFALRDATNTGFGSPDQGKALAGQYTRAAGFLAYYEVSGKCIFESFWKYFFFGKFKLKYRV